MTGSKLSYSPSLDTDAISNAVERCFTHGVIVDIDLERRIERLSRLFGIYSSTCPAPCWSKGLKISEEICRQTEVYLPYLELKSSFMRLVQLAVKVPHLTPPLISGADNWIDLLHNLREEHACVNPAELLSRLARDEELRKRYLFSIFLPDRYGGAFARYPAQYCFLSQWVKDSLSQTISPVICLDAASGSGEGSYELAVNLLASGVEASEFHITGITVCPIEVLSATYAYFPHAPERERRFRDYLKNNGAEVVFPSIKFVAADMRYCSLPESYHVIICNGILGGPLLHRRQDVVGVVTRFADRLHRGGMLLAADRFHAGWKKQLSDEDLKIIFANCGLTLVDAGEGVAGIRK